MVIYSVASSKVWEVAMDLTALDLAVTAKASKSLVHYRDKIYYSQTREHHEIEHDKEDFNGGKVIRRIYQ